MKTTFGTLALFGAVLIAGSALAQTAPRGPAPRAGATPPPAVGSVPPGQDQGQTRGTGVGGTAPDRAEAIINTTRSNIVPPARLEGTGAPVTPATPPPAVVSVPPGQDQGQTRGTGPVVTTPDRAEAIISTSRSNIKRPSVAVEGTGAAAPVVPPPIPPR